MKEQALKSIVKVQTVKWNIQNGIGRQLKTLHQQRSGQTVVTYALVTGITAVLGIALLTTFWGSWDDGSGLAGIFKDLINQLEQIFSGSGSNTVEPSDMDN